MPNVEVYTQDWCGFCARVMHLLTTKGIEVNEIYAPRGSEAREESVRRSGGRQTVPQVFVDGKHIGDCNELMALEATGKLDALLQGA